MCSDWSECIQIRWLQSACLPFLKYYRPQMMLHSSANRTGLLCKTGQTNPCFLQKQIRQKIHFDGSLSATECYPYKPCLVCACMYAHTPMHTAEIWKKCIDFILFPESILSLNRYKYFALYCCFCVRISFILLLIK